MYPVLLDAHSNMRYRDYLPQQIVALRPMQAPLRSASFISPYATDLPRTAFAAPYQNRVSVAINGVCS
ncbi:predicted protein [Plenodomus lingam JN3]|uniref:Predicted protein n=1 Tax=Leptosphaeria maculans (strain JN3 / isolate v23.1.3 / race Av1-4-5-6-7-8) TaxID=985895 RepID=E5A1X0_LEPMJ|nr:predicted protein [Plenodomus lingam JN3]CBX97687.1 predicted protein [Plenodomus lingam JN3]